MVEYMCLILSKLVFSVGGVVFIFFYIFRVYGIFIYWIGLRSNLFDFYNVGESSYLVSF